MARKADANRLSENLYYGVDFGPCSATRGFITQERYHSGEFKTHAMQGLTYNNGWDSKPTLKELVQHHQSRDIPVYEFDSYLELFNWILSGALKLEEPRVIIPLNTEYFAEVTTDGIVVGCQTFSFKKFQELADAVEAFEKGKQS